MKQSYQNTLGSERTVELEFMFEILSRPAGSKLRILDVGGIPSVPQQMAPINRLIIDEGLDYSICDFRGGDFVGDFVSMDFGDNKFDLIIFLSSLEHFPQCTEGDMAYRDGEDKRGFQKALSLLNDGGQILLTVPFGKQRWQPYHQNYDWSGILDLTAGSSIQESYTYQLVDSTEDKLSGNWVLSDPQTMSELIYTDRAFGCGCFLLQKTT